MSDNRTHGLSRRSLIGTAAGGAAALSLGVAGQAGAAPAPNLAMRQQGANIPTPREQTVVIQMGQTDIYDSFNPYIPNGEAINYGVHQVCREAFFIQNLMTGDLVPWLATDYAYNDDFTELTIHFNKDAAWSDGKPFTSDDVLFTFEMLKANENLYGSSDAQTPTDIQTPDAQTIVFTLPEPMPRWHLNFVAIDWSQWIRIVPKHIWEKEDPNTFTFNPPVYTGPYTLQEANPQTLMYVWKKNPDYWQKDVQFAPEYMIWMQALPTDAAVQEFQRGGLDVPGIDYLNQEVILSSYDAAVQAEYPDPCPRGFTPNNLSPLFQHKEGRWALSLLTNREVIANTIMQPPTEAARYPWPNYGSNEKYEIPELAEKYDLTEFNPKKAGELLDSIGATMDGDKRTLNGEELVVQIISPSAAGQTEFQIAQLVVQEAQKIGLDMQMVNLQGATYSDAVDLGNYDAESNWLCLGATPGPGTYSQFVIAEDEPPVVPIGERAEENKARIDIPELLPYVQELQTISPDDVENPAYRKALEIFFQELPVVPTVQTKYAFIFNTTYWTGWPTVDDPFAPPKHDLQTFILALAALKPAGES